MAQRKKTSRFATLCESRCCCRLSLDRASTPAGGAFTRDSSGQRNAPPVVLLLPPWRRMRAMTSEPWHECVFNRPRFHTLAGLARHSPQCLPPPQGAWLALGLVGNPFLAVGRARRGACLPSLCGPDRELLLTPRSIPCLGRTLPSALASLLILPPGGARQLRVLGRRGACALFGVLCCPAPRRGAPQHLRDRSACIYEPPTSLHLGGRPPLPARHRLAAIGSARRFIGRSPHLREMNVRLVPRLSCRRACGHWA